MAVSYHLQGLPSLACEQALRGPLAVGWEKEGELATMSLEFDYLHPKSQCEMLIGIDDISNDVTTLGMYFSMLVYSRSHFCFTLIGENLTAWSKGSHGGIGDRIKNSRDIAASSPSFSRPAARAPWRACLQAISPQPIYAFKSLFTRFIKETNTSNDCNSSLNKLWKTLGRRYSLHECWQTKWYLMTNLHCCTVMHLCNGILSLHSGWKF